MGESSTTTQKSLHSPDAVEFVSPNHPMNSPSNVSTFLADISQNSSPSLCDPTHSNGFSPLQLQHIASIMGLNYQQKQQSRPQSLQHQQQFENLQNQQNLVDNSNFQSHPTMNRGQLSRLNQIQQQQYRVAVSNAIRPQIDSSSYGQMNVDASSSVQQRLNPQMPQSGAGCLSRSSLIAGQINQLPNMPAHVSPSTFFNLQAQLSSNEQGQSLPRTSSVLNPQLLGFDQKGQHSMMQNALMQQQWMNNIPIASSLASSSYPFQCQQRQQKVSQQQQQQLMSSPQFATNSLGFDRNHISHLVQQQSELQAHVQLQHNSSHHIHQLPLQLQHQKQQSPKMESSISQIFTSSTVSQQNIPAADMATPTDGSSHGTENSTHFLGKRKLQDLVAQVDTCGNLDSDVQDLLLEIADDFIDSVTSFACNLAKHRKSSILEPKDLLLHLGGEKHS